MLRLFFVNTKNLTPNDFKIKERCCNFPLLEQKMKEYIIPESDLIKT